MTKFSMKLEGMAITFEGDDPTEAINVVGSALATLLPGWPKSAERDFISSTQAKSASENSPLARTNFPNAIEESQKITKAAGTLDGFHERLRHDKPLAPAKEKTTPATKPKASSRSIEFDAIVGEHFESLQSLHNAGKLSANSIKKLRGYGGHETAKEIHRRFLQRINFNLTETPPTAPKFAGLTEAQFERLDRLAVGKPLGVTAIADEFKVDKITAGKMLVEYQNNK